MIINNTLFVTVSICLGILIFLGLSIFVKRVFDSYYGAFFGLIFSAFGFGALQASFGKIYLVAEDLEVNAFRNIGEVAFTFENKDAIRINFPRGETGIINNSAHSLIVEELIYGPENYYKNDQAFKEIVNKIDSTYNQEETSASNVVNAYSFKTMPIKKHTINFFFDEDIPATIDEYGSYGNHVKYWLRRNESKRLY